MLLSKALCFWSAKTLPVWWPQSVTLIAKLLRIKWARQTAGTDLFVSSSPSFATIQHRLMQLGSEWMVEQTPAGECTSNSERISQNHLADEWRPLPRWKLLIVHLAKLGSWVIGNFFKNVFIPLPPLHAFGFWKQMYAKWLLLLMLVGAWGRHLSPWLCEILSVPWAEKCHLAIPYPHQGNFLSFL